MKGKTNQLKEAALKQCHIAINIMQEERPMLLHNILKAMGKYSQELEDENKALKSELKALVK